MVVSRGNGTYVDEVLISYFGINMSCYIWEISRNLIQCDLTLTNIVVQFINQTQHKLSTKRLDPVDVYGPNLWETDLVYGVA